MCGKPMSKCSMETVERHQGKPQAGRKVVDDMAGHR